MAFISGWGGRLLSGATALPVTGWQANGAVELVDITAGTTTNRQYVLGYQDVDVSFECLWDTSLNVLGAVSTFRIRPGDLVSLQLFFDRSLVQRSWLLPTFYVMTFTLEDRVREVCRYTCTGKQSGDGMTFPTN